MGGKTQIVNTRNRMLSQNIQMSLDTKHTDRNNNILIAGGSGCGKSFKWAKPNIMQMSSSYIITDPKGELCRDTAGFLRENGYRICVLNLIEFAKSSRYNPFNYLQTDTDLIILIGNLISNTTPKGASPSDPFWEKAEGLFLQSLFQYVWREGVWNEDTGKTEHNVGAVLKLLTEAEFKVDSRGNKMDSALDERMYELEEKNPNHPAVIQYNKVMRGAADTVRSIIISANSRLAPIQSQEIIDLLSEDEFNIPSIGTQKTAVYCIIPDSNKTYNFLVGMFYSQAFTQLYYTADFIYDGALPEHVTFLLDEFANVALPDDFCSLLSTMRSRNISSVIIIQNFGQLKALFKDSMDNIEGNCDVFIFLGGNEGSTHEKVSKAIGKQTIYKKSSSLSRGKNSSSSTSEDTLGREIMMPDEVRTMKRDECVVLINGFHAVKDKKIETWNHPLYKKMVAASKHYRFDARIERAKKMRMQSKKELELLGKSEADYLMSMDRMSKENYEVEKQIAELSGTELPQRPESRIISLTMEELLAIDTDLLGEENNLSEMLDMVLTEKRLKQNQEDIDRCIQEQEEEYRRVNFDAGAELSSKKEAKVYLRLSRQGYSAQQLRQILRLADTYDEDTIVNYFSPDMSEKDIHECVELLLL